MNYPKSLPKDQSGASMQEYPAPFLSTARSQRDNAVASSVLVLNQNSGALEVGTSGGQGLVIRWIPLTETASVSPFSSVIASGVAANFDHFVPPNNYRRFVIPRETYGQTASGQIGSMNGLYQRVAIVNAGTTASSVLTSEF